MDTVIFCSSIAVIVFMMTFPRTTTGCFGQGCAFQCHCEGTTSCNSVNGSCPNRCASGWAGEYCQRGNAANGKPASQSSPYERNHAGLAVDSDKGQGLLQCTHTQTENKPWWQVDLGRLNVVFMVTISNRGDCAVDRECRERLKNFRILMDNSLCYHYTGIVPSGGVVNIRCNSPTVGRVLKIQLQDSSTVLTMCDVMIQAYQYTACQNKRYGPNCNNRCQCANDAKCDDKTGGCSPAGCNDRFTGPYCNIEIPSISLVGTPTAVSIGVKWPYIRPHDSAYDAGDIQQYILFVTAVATNSRVVGSPGPGMMKESFTQLTPSTRYSFSIQVTYHSTKRGTDTGKGKMINFETKSCSEYMVSPVTSVISNRIDVKQHFPKRISLEISLQVAGMLSACNSGFDLYFKTSAETTFAKRSSTPNGYTLTNLKPYTVYEVKAGVKSPDGISKIGAVTRITTVEDVPGAPNITNFDASPDFISVTVAPPISSNGVITNYTLQLTSSTGNQQPNEISLTRKEFFHKFTYLDPNTVYNVRAKASTSAGAGNWSAVVRVRTIYYRVDVPMNIFPRVMLDKKTATTITINLQKIPKTVEFEWVRKIRIAVDMKSQTRRKRSALVSQEELKTLTDYNTAKKRDNPGLHIVAEVHPSFVGPFIIGDDKSYGSYDNPPLVPGQSYDIIYGLVFEVDGVTSFSYRRYGQFIAVSRGANAPLIVGVIFAVIVVLAAVIIPTVIILRRKRRRPDSGARGEENDYGEIPDNSTVRNTEESNYERLAPRVPNASSQSDFIEMVFTNPQEQTVMLTKLHTYVKSLKRERAAEFEDEHEGLPRPDEKNTKQAMKKENIALNRYKNIVAYDHSRVPLQPIGKEKSDYINASYINGYNKANIYIACQGPLPHTLTSMWRMIWQERSTTIVMLTNLREQNETKCEQYWPDEGTMTVGPFIVKTVDTYKQTDHVKRTLTVSLNTESLTVKQFHFTVWPENSVPKLACSMLNFRATVLKEAEYGKAPILVHCSDGVGRSGTFIATDYLIRQGQAEGKVDVYDCVLKMRKQRPCMVKNREQYMHIHDAVLEFFKIGITKFPSESFANVYKNLTECVLVSGNTTSKLQDQYSVLEEFIDSTNPSEEAISQKSKNRNINILPDERHRVVLSPVEGSDDYVNAVHATGYGEEDTYIITQMPFPETTTDFWRIVADTGTSTIVMMNVIDDTYEFSDVYWPKETERLQFGPIVVEGIGIDSTTADVIVRDFKVSVIGHGSESSTRQLRHFQLQTWPDVQPTPSSPESIVNLMKSVEKWQQQVDNKRILVQCMDGASQSGLFCAAHSVIEKVKVDHEVDVFQYVRLLKTVRPQFVNTITQYKFIHEVVLSYLQEFNVYANFQ